MSGKRVQLNPPFPTSVEPNYDFDSIHVQSLKEWCNSDEKIVGYSHTIFDGKSPNALKKPELI